MDKPTSKGSSIFFFLAGALLLVISIVRIITQTKLIYALDREPNALASLWKVNNPGNFNTEQGPIAITYHNTCFDKEMDCRLSDFYISSAFRPYQLAGHSYDICSLKSIKLTLDKGARFHYIDIWSSNPTNNLDNAAYPIVRNKTLMPRYGKALLFEDVCKTYVDNAWTDTNYPLILYFNIHPCSNGKYNRFMLRRVANILWDTFKGRFAPSKYSFGKLNIGEMQIREAMGTVTLLTNVFPEDGYLQELTHGVINTTTENSGTLLIYGDAHKNYGGTQAKSSNMDSVVERNRTHLGLVIPEEKIAVTNFVQPTTDMHNIDHTDPMKFGFHAIFLNWQKPGPERDAYVKFFKKRSFVLKEDGLRNLPCPKPSVLEQSPDANYAPRSMDVHDGYFAHNL